MTVNMTIFPKKKLIDMSSFCYLYAKFLYRNVTVCALVQVLSGENVVGEVPVVIPNSYAHNTASE